MLRGRSEIHEFQKYEYHGKDGVRIIAKRAGGLSLTWAEGHILANGRA